VYDENHHGRKCELTDCFRRNVASGANVIVMDELNHRSTYQEYFDRINSITGPDDINIIANSDIYFLSEDLEKMKGLHYNQCYALTRWDIYPDGMPVFLNRVDSQDCWIFRGKVKNVPGAIFPLGVPGCDNKMALLLRDSGYVVSNPSITIKSYHLHNSKISYYTRNDAVPPPYLRLTPTELYGNLW
jgi:hypothetical protein